MRCIKCGSRNVSLLTRNEGYSYSKGIIGQVVLGPVGAVAGINGKTSQMYHCNACGCDEITTLPEAIEGFIDEAIIKGDVHSLKVYKNQYPNIECNGLTNNNVSIMNNIPNQNGMNHNERVSMFSVLQNDKYYSSKTVLFGRLGVLVALECGSSAIEWFDFDNNDIGYVLNWYKKNADKIIFSEEAFCSLNSGNRNAYYSYPEIEDFLKLQKKRAMEERIDPSAYISNANDDELISKIKLLLRQSQLPQTLSEICGGMNLYRSSAINNEEKKACVEKAIEKMVDEGDARWKSIGGELYVCLPKNIEELKDWKAQSSANNCDYLSFVPEIYNYIVNREKCSLEEMIHYFEGQHIDVYEENKYLPSAIVRKSLEGLMRHNKILFIENHYTPITSNNLHKILRINSTVSENYLKGVNSDLYRRIIDLLRTKNADGITTSNILQVFETQYKEQKIYDQLLCAEYFGDARKEKREDEEIWFYVDAFKDERDRLEEEITSLEIQIHNQEKEIEEYEQGKDARIQQVNNELFDDHSYLEKINALKKQIENDNTKISTLGFFKKKEKEALKTQIFNKEADIERLTEECNRARKEHIQIQLHEIDREGRQLHDKLNNLRDEQNGLKQKLYIYRTETVAFIKRKEVSKIEYTDISSDERLVYDTLKSVGKTTITNLMENIYLMQSDQELSVWTYQKLNGMLRKLITKGLVEKTMVGRVSYFEVIE